MATDPTPASRPHTGRRRNPAVREAVLRRAADLLAGPDGMAVTIDAIARAAGVSKHTIYRWWPSKGAVLLEAVVEHAQQEVPVPDTGVLAADLEIFLSGTFLAVERAGDLFRALAAEALRDTAAAEGMRAFIAARRDRLRALLVQGRDRGELPAGIDLELTMDQVYGLMWYRLLIARTPLTAGLAAQLTEAVIGKARPHAPGPPAPIPATSRDDPATSRDDPGTAGRDGRPGGGTGARGATRTSPAAGSDGSRRWAQSSTTPPSATRSNPVM